jgi:hypothetical protein
LSVEPYHAACADDAKRRHLLLPKRNMKCALVRNGSPVAMVFDADSLKSEMTDLGRATPIRACRCDPGPAEP